MPRLRLLLLLALAGCSTRERGYEPEVGTLPSEAFAGAELHLAVDPLPTGGDSLHLTIAEIPVAVTTTDSGITFVVPDTLDGEVALALASDDGVVWEGSLVVAGFTEAKETGEWIGAGWWNLMTTEQAGVTRIWGRTANDGLGWMWPSSGVVGKIDSMLPEFGLRVPGPTAVPGQYLVAPAGAVALDSLEIWQLTGFPAKVGRVGRHGVQRQAAMLDGQHWLITGSHGAWSYDAGADSILFVRSNGYEEPQVIFRAPAGDRTTFTFHGGSSGTPVFGPDGFPVYHVKGMRGPGGVAFSRDSTTMILVGYSQDYSDLLMEVELDDGARVDSVPLGYAPRAVAIDDLGRAYVLGEGVGGRPFIDVLERPGYRRLGRMQAPPGVRACAYGCMDGVLAFDLVLHRIYAVDAADPSFAGATGNGIWAFRMLAGAPVSTASVRLR